MTSGFYYDLLAPTARCSSVVQFYYEVDINPEMLPEGYLHTILPFIGSEWVITLTGNSSTYKDGRLENNPYTYISTQTTISQTILFDSVSKIFVIRFQPFFLALAQRRAFPKNERIFPQQIFGPNRVSIEELRTACSFKQRVNVIETFIGSYLDDFTLNPEYLDLLTYSKDLMGASGEMSLLAERLGISVRQLERRFKNILTLTPSDFFKLKRLQKSLEVYASNPEITGTEATYIGGFSDQAHFIHSFKQYFSETPSTFFKNRPFLRKKNLF